MLHYVKAAVDTTAALPSGVKMAADTTSVGVLLSSIVGLLPAVASGLTVVWMLIRIYETKTVQRLFHGKGKS